MQKNIDVEKRPLIRTTPSSNTVDQQLTISADLLDYMKGFFDLDIFDHLDQNGNISTMLQDESIFCLSDLLKVTHLEYTSCSVQKYKNSNWYYAIIDMILSKTYFKISFYNFNKEQFESMDFIKLITIFDEMHKKPQQSPMVTTYNTIIN